LREPKKPFFFGYWILLSTFLCLFFWAGLVMYSFSLYVQPLTADFGWGRAAIMLAPSLSNIMTGLFSPVVGRLLRSYGARYVMVFGSIVMGAGFSLLAWVRELWHFYMLFALIGIGGAAIGVVSTTSIVSNWFQKRRGWAIGILGMGIGAGGFAMPLLVGNFLIQSFGWRTSFLVSGVMIALTVTPLALLVIRLRPEYMGLHADGIVPAATDNSKRNERSSESDVNLQGALRSLSFWAIAVSFACFNMANMIMFQNHAPSLRDTGFTVAVAATAISLAGIGSTIAKFSFGWLCDFISAKYVLVAGIVLQAVAVLLLMNIGADSPTVFVWTYAFLLGLSFGSWLPAMTIMVGRNFGTTYYGIIYGTLNMMLMIFSAIGPVVAGLIFDTFGSYFWAFILVLALSVISMSMVQFVRKVKQD
jgi:MFS family permease